MMTVTIIYIFTLIYYTEKILDQATYVDLGSWCGPVPRCDCDVTIYNVT